MSTSYQAKDSGIYGQQLKWETLVLHKDDLQFVTGFVSADPIVDCINDVSTEANDAPAIYAVLAAGGALVAPTGVVIAANLITPSFAAALTSGDALVVNFVYAHP